MRDSEHLPPIPGVSNITYLKKADSGEPALIIA